MTIEVYGKPECDRCDAAKAKLKLMELDYQFRNIQEVIELHDGWQTDGSIAALAAYHSIDMTLPVIIIDGKPYNYSGAMRELKRRKASGEEAEEAKSKGDELSSDH